MRFCNYRLSESRRGPEISGRELRPEVPVCRPAGLPVSHYIYGNHLFTVSLLSEKLFKYNLFVFRLCFEYISKLNLFY